MKLSITMIIAVIITLIAAGCDMPGTAPDKPASGNTNLQNLEIDQGLLSPQFSNDSDVYTLKVDEDCARLTLSCETEDANAWVEIEGQAYGHSAGDVGITLSNLVGSSINIIVTAENGAVRTITILVKQAKVYKGDYVIRSREDAEGLRNYTAVTGKLTISYKDQVETDALRSLEEIGGDLVIENCPYLENLGEFAGLTRVGGGLRIGDNPAPLSFTQCVRLESIGGTLWLRDNQSTLAVVSLPALTDLRELYLDQCNALTKMEMPVLKTVAVNITINGNSSLAELTLPKLEHVGRNVDILMASAMTDVNLGQCRTVDGRVEFDSCGGLAAVDLHRLETVGGDFVLSRCDAFSGPLSLPNLETAGGRLVIENVAGITEISCEKLRNTIDLSIQRNDNLVRITLPLFASTSRVDIEDNPRLTGINLSGLLKPGLYCNIIDNPELAVLDLTSFTSDFTVMRVTNADKLVTFSLPNALHIDCLTIYGNDSLESISLPQLTQIGSLTITDNTHLKTVTTGYITSMDDRLEITGNPVLENIDFTIYLKSVVYKIDIADNAALEYVWMDELVQTQELNVSGNNALKVISCNSLQNLSQNLYIYGNPDLEKVMFRNLTTVDNYFIISSNTMLSSIAFDKLKSIGVYLCVKDNPQLPTQDVNSLRNRLTTKPQTTEISGNKP
jgi:hypothetical protein